MKKSIHQLEIHDYLQVNNSLLVQKVYGGYNYIYTKPVWDDFGDMWEDEITHVVFVPMV